MAVCKDCGKKFGFLETGVGGLCVQCDWGHGRDICVFVVTDRYP